MRGLGRALGFGVAAVLASGGAEPAAAALPNLVYILADDLGLGDLTGYNPASKVRTPEMDGLMAEGMRFIDAHSGSSVCTPTRYGILTGRYAWRSRLKSGVLDTRSKRLIEPGRLTVAAMLKQKGYRTACIGKWHLGLDWADPADWSKGFGNGPLAVGFDSFHGIPASLDMEDYAYLEGNRAVAAPTEPIAGSPWPAFWRKGKMSPGFRHQDVLPVMADKAAAFLRDHKTSGGGRPFFLYLALPSPHTPHVPTDTFKGTTQAGVRGDYVAATDWAVGRVRKVLDSLGLAANTVVIVTSDNGAHDQTYRQNGHTPHMALRGQKADIYEAGHRVPFLVRWPGVVKPGTVSGETLCLTDFLATAAAIASYRLPDSAGEDSYSFLPVLLGKTLAGPLREATIHHSAQGTFAVRRGAWKLAVDNKGSGGFTDPAQVAGAGTLFDLAKNPGEDALQDQYAKNPAVVQELRSLLAKYQAEGRSTPKGRQDEFWQDPVGARGEGAPRSSARLSVRGGELRLSGAGEGWFHATVTGMDGRPAWKGFRHARNGEAGIGLGSLPPGIYGVLIRGDGWTLRGSLVVDVFLMDARVSL